jgi:hypothetical protein
MQVDGQCHCGGISYLAEIDPQRVAICHCTDCQIFSSSAYRLSVRTGRDKVRITGTPKTYAKTAESGAVRLQHFCGDCGTPMFTSGTDVDVGDRGIRWGTIRQRNQLPPARQIWCSSAEPWVSDLTKLPGTEAG